MNAAQLEVVDASTQQVCQSLETVDAVNKKYLHNCEVCSDAEGIYKCPACSMFTCSLKCCLQHKAEVRSTCITFNVILDMMYIYIFIV